MSYQQLQGQRMLDDAKQRAEEVINALPDRSQVAVIPWCGSELGRTRDSYRNKTDAIEAVRRIEIVDRRGTVNQAVDLALEAFTAASYQNPRDASCWSVTTKRSIGRVLVGQQTAIPNCQS